MKTAYNQVSAVFALLTTLMLPTISYGADIIAGSGSAAEKLILDWANVKPGKKSHTIRFSPEFTANDPSLVQNGSIDFAVLDAPMSDGELSRMNLIQIPFSMNGASFVINLPNNMAGAIRLDGQTLGKIFSGEISNWNDPAISSLNPKHDLPEKPIIIVHSGNSSYDFPMISAYLSSVNDRWKSGYKGWPANAIETPSFSARIASIKATPYSIGYLPMQYLPQRSLAAVHIKNRDGSFSQLSDIGIMAAAGLKLDESRSESLSLINKSSTSSWPISSYVFLVISKDRVRDEKIGFLLSTIHYGLKFGSLKPTIYNYVALPDVHSKAMQGKLEPLISAATLVSAKAPAMKVQEPPHAPEIAAKKKDEETAKPRIDAAALQEERNRLARIQADEQAREQAIKEARAAKLAAEEAIRQAQAAKLEAEKLAEKNRQVAKAEHEKAERERIERERIEREKAEHQKAIQQRNQKDEDPLEAYHRSLK